MKDFLVFTDKNIPVTVIKIPKLNSYLEISLSDKAKSLIENGFIHLDGNKFIENGLTLPDQNFLFNEEEFNSNIKKSMRLNMLWSYRSYGKLGYVFEEPYTYTSGVRMKLKLINKVNNENIGKLTYIQEFVINNYIYRVNPYFIIYLVCNNIKLKELVTWVERRMPYSFIRSLGPLPLDVISITIGKQNNENKRTLFINRDYLKELINIKLHKDINLYQE